MESFSPALWAYNVAIHNKWDIELKMKGRYQIQIPTLPTFFFNLGIQTCAVGFYELINVLTVCEHIFK